ncbi:MAG: hypothetical protein IJK35_10525 [Oscillospiraceae bacterium]|nr:hypothetical protein [Oscillospiraceae bacterium]
MKRICLLLAVLLLLLCACGSEGGESTAPTTGEQPVIGGQTQPGGEGAPSPTAAPVYTGDYRRVDITADNWGNYFELKEIPLYTVTQGDVIAQVCQNYCVVLREEYLPYLKPNGNFRVEFDVSFDLYIDTMDIDTNEGVYRHTDDLFYAVDTTKHASFDRSALPASAYGADASLYTGFSNAFFTGYCTLHSGDELGETRVWSGFYIDLSKARVESVSGYLELGG